jgi:hypothetical protein
MILRKPPREAVGAPHVVIWPEGRPDEAKAPTGFWGVLLHRMRLYLRNHLAPSRTRRVRVATCDEGHPDPHVVEAALEDLGATAPPGGWPRPRRSGSSDPDTPRGDVSIVTHSVL